MTTATVHVDPGGFTFTGPVGETIMNAAQEAGVRWPTVCGGVGSCTICHVLVLDGSEHLSPAGPAERDVVAVLARRYPIAQRPLIRLACQARCYGDIIVFKRGVLSWS